ncbi:MAG: hypothetical protein BroJett031_02220 [Betaproteobacteria bacterium]|nr:MAG: hypothetical protein BroJett031_02220 [Betaproteobacteria bacterium]
MQTAERFVRLAAAALAVLALAACGGGGGGGGSAPAPAPSVAPQISMQPGSRALAVGLTATFSVGAIGTPPLAYQWLKNGMPITGATDASYTTPPATLADDGARFSVVVSNAAGATASAQATLAVYPTPAPAASCANPADAFSALGDVSVAVGKAAGAVVANCAGTGTLTHVRWTQTAGNAVALISDKTQAISFEPTSAGVYAFRADFNDATGTARSASVAVTAVAGGATVLARADHAVRKGGNVSLRAWTTLPPGDAIASLAWTQIEGPPVVLDVADPHRVLFTAPDVARDTLLRFRVTLRTTQGLVDSDDALVLVENYAQAPDNSNPHVFSGLHVSRVYPYKATSPFAADLVRCTYDAALRWTDPGRNACTLATLPFLHQTTGGNEPTVAQIMDRVLVSHDWMGAVFEQFIAGSDKADIRRLLNGVTAIVIGAQVRPSFYYGLTGAIYLDADNLWLTPEQRDVINEAPDFRSDFDRDLAYSGVWRYTLNNNNVFLPWPATSRLTRTVDYLLYEAGWLMYHELAHASDFLPPATRGALNNAATVWDNVGPRFANAQLPSDDLARSLPLQSAEMRALALVKFQGVTATPAQRAYTPQQVAGFFAPDRATDEYNYSTTREDIAMLFEEFMMFRNHGVRRDVAITDKIGPTTTGATLIVRWGQRGRVAETAVRPRVKLAVGSLAPWIDPASVDAFPAPLAMRAGKSWNANLVLPAPPSGVGAAAVRTPASKAEDAYLLERAQRRGRGGIPGLLGERSFGAEGARSR